MGVAKTEKALRAEVEEVCKSYCLQVWNKTLDQAGVEASSALKRVDSVYYPPAICASSSASSKTNTTFEVANIGKDSPTKAPLSPLPRKPSSPGLLKKKQTQPMEWPMMPPSPQLLLRTPPK